MNSKISSITLRSLAESEGKKAVGAIAALAGFASASAVVFNYFVSPADFRPIALSFHIALMALGGYWIFRPPERAQLCLLCLNFYLVSMATTFAIGQDQTGPIVGLGVIWFAATYFIHYQRLLLVAAVATLVAVTLVGFFLHEKPDFWVQTSTFLIIFLGGIGMHAGRRIMMTELVASQQRMLDAIELERSAESQLAELNRLSSITAMARGVAHDFNNLLQGIVGGVDLLPMAKADEQRERYLQMIRSSAEAAQGLCHELMELSGGRPPQFAEVEIHALFQECLLASGDNERVTLELPGDKIYVQGDFRKLQRLFLNLINNALEAIHETEGKVTLGAVVVAGEVTMYVEDNGPGIKNEARDKLFEPFYTDKASGKGLGLAVAAAVAREHKSEISIATREKGACFQVRMPAHVVAWQEQPAATQTAYQAEGMIGKRVLVVDDDQSVLQVTESMLTSLGMEVTCFSDPAAALVDFSRRDPGYFDFSIIDSTMPGMSGNELIGRLRKINPFLKVVLCSGHVDLAQDQDESNAIADFLPKPFKLEELLAVLARVQASHKA